MRLVLVFRAGRIESKIFPDCFGRTGKKHRGLICLVLLLCARRRTFLTGESPESAR